MSKIGDNVGRSGATPPDAAARLERRERQQARRQERFVTGRNAVLWSMSANVVAAILKGAIGILAGSTALVADAAHSLADVVNSTVSLASLFVARRPPDERHHYGHGRSEALAAVVTAVVLLLGGVFVVLEALSALSSPTLGPPSYLAVVVAMVVLVLKLAVARAMSRVGRTIANQAVSALASDTQSDAFSAIAVIVGDTLARLTNRPQLDPLAAVVVGLLIFGMGLLVTWRSFLELSDPSPAAALYGQIRDAVRRTPGVADVLDVDALAGGGDIRVRADIEVDPALSLAEAAAIAERVRQAVEATDAAVSAVIVQLFPSDNQATATFDHEQHP